MKPGDVVGLAELEGGQQAQPVAFKPGDVVGLAELEAAPSFAAQSGLERNISTPLTQGLEQAKVALGGLGLSQAQQKLEALDVIDKLRSIPRAGSEAATRPGIEVASQLNVSDPGEYARTRWADDPDILDYARVDATEETRQALRARATAAARVTSQQAADAMNRLALLPQDEELNAAIQTDDLATIASAIANDPMRLWRLALPSMVTAVPGMVGGPAGVALTSGTQEFGSAIIQAAADAGLNPYRTEDLQKIISDPQLMTQARENARKAGASVALFDLLGAKFAARGGIVSQQVKGPIKREIAGIAENLPIQAATGAAGEATKQQLTTGSVSQPGQVFLEAIAELGGAPFEVVGLGLATGRYRKGGGGLIDPDVDAPIGNKEIGQLIEMGEVKTPVKIETPVNPDAPVTETPVVTTEQPGTKGDVPPVESPELPKIALQDLPPATEIVASKGYQGSAEALKQARLAQRSNKRAEQYSSQGLPELAMKERKAAQTALQEALRLGFRMPEKAKPEAPVTGPSPNYPGWTVAPKENRMFKPTEQGLFLHVRFVPELKGWIAYPGDTENEQPPASLPGKVFKSPKQAVAAIETILAKVTAAEEPPAPQPTKPMKKVTAPAPRSDELFYAFPPAHMSRNRPIASFKSQEAAQVWVNEMNERAKVGGVGPSYRVEKRPKREFGDIATPDNLEMLLRFKMVPQQLHTSNIPTRPTVIFEGNYPDQKKQLDEGKQVLAVAGLGVDFNPALNMLKELQRRFTPDLKFVLDMRGTSPYAGPHGGLFAGYAGGYAVIWLNPKESGVLQLSTLTHEFGHALMFARFREAKPTVQQAIFRDWQNHLEKHFEGGSKSTAHDFYTDFFSWPKFDSMVWGLTSRGKTNQDAYSFITSSEIFQDWYSFDEFMAEQISRWMLTTDKPVGIASKFYKAVANMLRNVLKYGHKGSDFKAPPAVAEWLNSLMRRDEAAELTPITPITVPGAIEGFVRGKKENQIGDEPYELTPLPQSENHYLHEAAPRLGVSKKAVVQQDRYTSWLRFWPNLLQIADKNKHIKGLQRYVEITRAWMIEKMQIISRADTRVKAWRKLGKEMGSRLSKFLFELEDMSYLKPGENARWPTVPELIAIAKKNGLNQEAIQVYFNVKADFLDILDRIEQAWIKDAQRSFQDPAALAREIFNIKTEMNTLRSKPYFPHERFGDWTVTVWSAKGGIKHFEQVHTAREADQLAARLRHIYPGDRVGAGKLSEEVKIFQGLPPTLLRQLATKIRGLSGQQLEDIEKLVFAMSPANSFAKHFSKRKGTAGYSTDGLRSYANYFLHAGGHIARLKWRADLEDAITEVERSGRNMQGVFSAAAVGKRQGIADWLKRHLDYIMNPPNEWTAMRSFAFFWYLAWNASSAVVNLTQVPMVAYPYLAARYGDFGALNQLRKAVVDIHKMYGMRAKLPQDERDAIAKGVEQGFLDESQNADLAGAAQHGVLGRIIPGTAIERGRMALAHYGSLPFQLVEKMNRRIVFRAAYRLAKTSPQNKAVMELVKQNQMLFQDLLQQGWSPVNAGAFIAARDAIEKSQFNYAAYARPEFIRGKKGVLFAFWMFKQNMLYFYRNDPGAWRALLVMAATSGLMGLPFAGDLAEVVKFAAHSLFGKDFDPEREARDLIIELAGEGGLSKDSSRRTADLIMLGLGRESFGLTWMGEGVGVPIPALDISGRLGMGHVVPGLRPLIKGAEGQLRPDEALGQVAREVAGASYGVPLAILRAAESGDLDEFKTWERMLPIAAKNVVKAYRLGSEGAETNRAGARIAEFDVTDSKQAAELIAVALGFQPTKLTRNWDVVAEQREVIGYWMIQRKMLFEEFDKARLTKDREAMADVKEALRRFNHDAPDKRLRIGHSDLLQSSKQRERNRQKMERGRALQNTYQGVSRDVQGIYPK